MHRELHTWIAEHSGQPHDQSDDPSRAQATQSHDQQPHDQGGSPRDDGESDEHAIEMKYPLPSSRVTNLVETIHEA